MSKSVQITLAVIILTVVIVGGFYYYKDKPVEPINLASESDEFQLTKDQYQTILNGVFFADEEGKIIPKADYAMAIILDLKTRIETLEQLNQTGEGLK